MKTDDDILEILRHSSQGLSYMSESDYPFQVVRWRGEKELDAESLRVIAGESADAPIEEFDVDLFLGGRYQNLAQLLKSNLSKVKVFKVGSINKPVYIVGRSPEGNWLGLSTRVVET